MARLASIEKLGYYPLPPVAQQRLAHLLTAKPGAYLRIYDPCAGQGAALRYFADELHHFDTNAAHPLVITTYGVEISAPRAPLAAQVLHHVIQADYENVRCPDEAFSFLVLNPPYDLEGANEEHLRRNRLEYTFLRNTLSRLQIGGLLMYIVPQPILARDNVAKFLSAHLTRITIFRFPKGEFEMFDQIALLAYRKPQAPPDPAEIERITAMGKGIKKIPHIPMPGVPMDPNVTWLIPAATLPDKDMIFQRHQLTDEDILALYQTQNAFQTDAWRTFVSPPPPSNFTPLIPLRPNHIAALISSGQVGSVLLPSRGPSGRGPILAKGITAKVVHKTEDDEKVQPDSTVVRETEEYKTTIYTLTASGQHTTITSIPDLNQFLKDHTDALAQLLDQHYTPLYTAPTYDEWQQISRLVPYKRLPGRDEAGLLLAQKHAAIATARSAQAYGWADLLGQMGTGKSATSLAAIDLLDAYPAWVEAPTHTLENWCKEVTDTVPDATPFLIRSLGDLQRFQRNYRPGKKWIAIFSIESAKLGPGWRPATVLRTRRLYETDADGKPISRLVKFHCCPRCGTPAWRVTTEGDLPDLISEDVLNHKNRQFCTAPVRRWQGDPAGDNRKGQWITTDLQDVTEGNGVKTLTRDTLRCGAPLFVFAGFRRWPLATYIHDHLPGFFQGGIADEVHKNAAKGTDAAIAYHHLVDSTRYLLNLTGTYFSGYASSLFWLRYRVDPAVRQDFDFHSEQRWAQLYGRIERLVDESATWTEDGAFSGTHRYVISTRELSGLSPIIYRRLLQTTIFLRIDDLGYTLPPYEEQVVLLSMTSAQEADYNRLNDTLMATIMEGRGRNADEYSRQCSQALLGVWLQATLGRPNSSFREEAIRWKPPGATQHVPFTITASTPEKPMPALVDKNTWTVEDHAVYNLTGHLPATNQPTPADTTSTDDLSLPANAFSPNDSFDLALTNQTQTKLSTGHPITEKLSTGITKACTVSVPFILPPVVTGSDLLPKEQWLLDFSTEEIKQGRKILLYVRQTGKRDIQPRLAEILARANLRALILPDTVQPIRRERWIKQNMHLLDVLETNPKKVETGLNLVDFATICFYEIEYSLYTLMQAMYRVWRLGQTRPVKVIFPLYQNTLEQQAFWLQANKVAAARLLYGDNASGAFAGGSNDLGGNLLQELARRITTGQLIQSNGLSTLLTTNHNKTSEWSLIATPGSGVPSGTGPSHPIHANGHTNDAHSEPATSLFNSVFASLFANTTNPQERRQRDAGQIGLFA